MSCFTAGIRLGSRVGWNTRPFVAPTLVPSRSTWGKGKRALATLREPAARRFPFFSQFVTWRLARGGQDAPAGLPREINPQSGGENENYAAHGLREGDG